MRDATMDRLVDFAVGLSAEDLPADVVHQARRLIVDSLGCAVGAMGSEPARIVQGLAGPGPLRNGASILGTDGEASADLAAFANGSLVRYLDFNDAYGGKDTSHPSDNLTVVLAAAEARGRTGADVILAFVIAYEIQAAFSDTHRIKAAGPWDQACYALASTAVGAAKVMGLDRDRMRNALALNLTQGLALGESRRGDISHIKASTVANAGRNAIFFADLAERGFTGPPLALEGPLGFFTAIAREPLDLAPLHGEPGADPDFRISRSRIKRFPAGFFSQTAIECALECRQQLAIDDGDDVATVSIRTFPNTIRAMAGDPSRWRPRTRETADHSLPFVIAMALQAGAVEPDQFVEEVFGSERTQALMDKVSVELDAECEAAWPDATLSIVRVETRDGRSHTARAGHHLGHYRRPMDDDALAAKFRMLCDGRLTAQRQEEILDQIRSFERVGDLKGFMRLFR